MESTADAQPQPQTPPDGSSGRGPLHALAQTLEGIAVELAGAGAGAGAPPRAIALERPPRAELGDYSSNAALVLASVAKRPPRELAQQIGERAGEIMGSGLERFEVAGPGFVNLFLSDEWHLQSLKQVLRAGEGYGADGAGAARQRMLVEFVSANPTGPMHVGHARNAAYGDTLARILAFHGHRVEREFYVNDAGSQIRKLGESIRALARGEELPADGYRGEYVQGLAERLADAASADASELGRAAVAKMVKEIRDSLRRFNVAEYDHWQYESELHRERAELTGADGQPVSAVAHALQLLEEHGHTYRSEGALWLRSTQFGDDKDRVLTRSSGEHTYFASDIAYHQAKRERGFDRQIDVWGADHHGYLPRMRAAYQALGGDADELEMVIMQLVHLLRKGKRAQMSKRAGEFVTLDDLVDEIGVDAARWYLLSRSHETTIDLDLELASRQSSENPVYYVQYAHARIQSIINGQKDDPTGSSSWATQSTDGCAIRGSSTRGAGEPARLHAAERALIRALLDFPGQLREAAERRAPHRVAAYALLLAQEFTAFYRDCRVIGAEGTGVQERRLALSAATQGVLARCLGLLGVSAPERM